MKYAGKTKFTEHRSFYSMPESKITLGQKVKFVNPSSDYHAQYEGRVKRITRHRFQNEGEEPFEIEYAEVEGLSAAKRGFYLPVEEFCAAQKERGGIT